MQDDLQNDSLYLPPCHADAAKPEDVYRFEDSILADERVSSLRAVMLVHIGRARLCRRVVIVCDVNRCDIQIFSPCPRAASERLVS